MAHNALNVVLLPALCKPTTLTGFNVVVVDILRATTVISHAIANGGIIRPCQTIDEAHALRKDNYSGSDVLLGGEREGKLIDGFDLSNSPAQYTSDKVKDKTILFTTTNGTKAMKIAVDCGAETVVLGSFANLSATAKYLVSLPHPVSIVCAGTNGAVTREDVLFAGALVSRLVATSQEPYKLDDQALIAQAAWEHISFPKDNLDATQVLFEELKKSYGGQNLVKLGYDADIEIAATQDSHPVTPVLDTSSWTIRDASST